MSRPAPLGYTDFATPARRRLAPLLLMTHSHPRRFALTLLLSVYAAASTPLHSSGPLVNLNVVVLDAAARPIVGATLTIGADERRTDGRGFVNFAVPGPVLVDVVAPGYRSKRVDLPPGNHRVHLELARAGRVRSLVEPLLSNVLNVS